MPRPPPRRQPHRRADQKAPPAHVSAPSAGARETGARGLKEGERFEEELKRDEYEGTFNDFAEIVLLRCFGTLFSLGWFLVPTRARVEVRIQGRVDAE